MLTPAPVSKASPQIHSIWRQRRYWPSFTAAILAGLLLRVWFVFHFAHVTGDSLIYGDIARNLLQFHIYGFTDVRQGLVALPEPTLIRLPGYPFFLAACFKLFGPERYTAVLALQVVIDLLSCLLVADIAGRWMGNRALHIALWLAMLCPFTANYVAAALTETLTLFCLTLAFYTLIRWQAHFERYSQVINPWLLPLSVALAGSVLLRPEQGLLVVTIVVAVAWIAFKHISHATPHRILKALRPALIVAVLSLLPLVPWTIRNWQVFHVIQPLAPRYANDPGEANPYGFQRWYRTWAIEFASTENTYWPYDGSSIEIAELPNRAFDSDRQYAETAVILAQYNEKNSWTPALDAAFNHLAEERIRANPMRYYFAMPVARLFNMAFRPRTEMLPIPLEWWDFQETPLRSAFALGFAMLNAAYFGLAFLGWLTLRRQRKVSPILYAMLASIALRVALLLTLDNSEPRYTLEFFPIFFVLASGYLASLRTRET